jgi:hypothetical protein
MIITTLLNSSDIDCSQSHNNMEALYNMMKTGGKANDD